MKKTLLAGAAAMLVAATACTDHVGGSSATDTPATFEDSLVMVFGKVQGEQFAQFLNRPDCPIKNREAVVRGIREVMKVDTADVSYIYGLSMGMSAYTQYQRLSEVVDIDKAAYTATIIATVNADSLPDADELRAQQQILMGQVQERQAKKAEEEALNSEEGVANRKASDEFFASLAKQTDVKPLTDGILYKTITSGTGAKPGERERVKVAYTMTTIAGDTIASTTVEKPATFLAGMPSVKPLTKVLKNMAVGETSTFYIPWEEAFGAVGNPNRGIKPCQSMVINATLLEIVKK